MFMTRNFSSFSALMAITLLVLASCAKSNLADTAVSQDKTQGDIMSECPVLDSRDWTAFVDAEPPLPARLHIRGEVDLPTPGFIATWRLGIADRAMPPGQHVHLDFIAPDGMTAQVVTPTQVTFSQETPFTEYRQITLHCGDQVLAVIKDIPVGL